MAEDVAGAVLDASGGTEASGSPAPGAGGQESVIAPALVAQEPGADMPANGRTVPQEAPRPGRTPDGRFAAETPPVPAPSPAPQPAPTPEPLEGARDQDDTLLNWKDLADPEYRKDPVLNKYKTVGEALKALVHNERMLGNSITIPKDGASDTQWRHLYEKLGCPSSPGEYTITDPDMGTDEDGTKRTLAPNFLVSLLETAHRAGLNTKQAQELVNFAGRTIVQSTNLQAGEMAMQKVQAERELFEAFAGDAATMIQKATMALSRLGEGRYGGGAYAQRAAEKLRASTLGNDVDVIAAMANLWDNMSEGQFIEGVGGAGLSSRDQVQADIAALGAIMNDPAKSMDERVAAQKKQFSLFQDLNALDEAAARRQNGFRR